MFLDSEKTDIRRFCGYPAYGAGAAGFQSWRFFQAYGTLEYRLNNLSPSEEAVVRSQLATLYGLEAAVPAAAATLDTAQASVWTRNAAEVTDRAALFDDWRRRLAAFLGIPAGPALAGTGAGVRLGGVMDAALLQDRIDRGMGIAARHIGVAHDAYRPIDGTDPLASARRFLRLPAAFNAQDVRFRVAGLPADAVWYGVLDAAYLRAGDYLVEAGGAHTWFVGALQPLLPPICVLCKRGAGCFPARPGQRPGGETATAAPRPWCRCCTAFRPACCMRAAGTAHRRCRRIPGRAVPPRCCRRSAASRSHAAICCAMRPSPGSPGRSFVVGLAERNSLGWRLDLRQAAS